MRWPPYNKLWVVELVGIYTEWWQMIHSHPYTGWGYWRIDWTTVITLWLSTGWRYLAKGWAQSMGCYGPHWLTLHNETKMTNVQVRSFVMERFSLRVLLSRWGLINPTHSNVVCHCLKSKSVDHHVISCTCTWTIKWKYVRNYCVGRAISLLKTNNFVCVFLGHYIFLI